MQRRNHQKQFSVVLGGLKPKIDDIADFYNATPSRILRTLIQVALEKELEKSKQFQDAMKLKIREF